MKSWKTPLLSWMALLGFGIFAQEGLDSFLQYQLNFILINITLALSLNLVNGITGQFSLGHAGFMAVGAYISAFGLTHLHLNPSLGHFFLWACFGGLGACLAGFIVGLPSLRLRGDYLAVVTLGFGEIIRVLALNIEAVGGARGLPDIPAPHPLRLGSWEIGSFLQQFLHSGFWALVCFFTCWRLVKSGIGRGFLSVREDELAAEACGVPTTRAKIQSFMLGSGFAGVAGACLASLLSFINPATFGISRSIDVVVMVVLGGMGSFSGAIVAAILISLLPELLRPLQEVTGYDLRMVLYSLALVLVMILRPQGLLGRHEVEDTWKRWRKRFHVTS